MKVVHKEQRDYLNFCLKQARNCSPIDYEYVLPGLIDYIERYLFVGIFLCLLKYLFSFSSLFCSNASTLFQRSTRPYTTCTRWSTCIKSPSRKSLSRLSLSFMLRLAFLRRASVHVSSIVIFRAGFLTPTPSATFSKGWVWSRSPTKWNFWIRPTTN